MDQKLLKDIVEYFPDTGAFVYKNLALEFFSSSRLCKSWNTKYANNDAGTVKFVGRGKKTPYKYISILGKSYKASRLAYFYMTGEWPKGQIDHLNHNSLDDRWCNLEIKSHKENGRNQRVRSTNKSGVMGVRFDRGKWVAQICVNGKTIYLGRFNDFGCAVDKRREAEIFYGFHINHNKED